MTGFEAPGARRRARLAGTAGLNPAQPDFLCRFGRVLFTDPRYPPRPELLHVSSVEWTEPDASENHELKESASPLWLMDPCPAGVASL